MLSGHRHAQYFILSLCHVHREVQKRLPTATHEDQLKHNPDNNKLLGDVRDTLSCLWFVFETGFHTTAHAGPKLVLVFLPQPPKC